MADRTCSLCGEVWEDPHDLVLCEKAELLKGRETIKKLTASLYDWKHGKGGWFDMRDLIGKLSWEHHECPHEKQSQPVSFDVYHHGTLVGSGASQGAADAIERLILLQEPEKK